jgi:hypothetical protein
MYRLHRTAFQIQTHKESNEQRQYWLKQSVIQRLSAAWYLTCSAYNLDYQMQQKLDRNVFSVRKHLS